MKLCFLFEVHFPRYDDIISKKRKKFDYITTRIICDKMI